MSLTKIMLLVLMALLCVTSAQVTLTRVFPEDGAYICPGDVVTYKCVVQSFQLTWTYTSDEGGTESHNYLYSTPVTGNVTFLGPFGLVLESVVGSNPQSTITSTANATSGLAPTDNGKVITCVASMSKSMEISFTAPTITIISSSDCQDVVFWSLPPCQANCTVSVNGKDIVTVPCSDGNVSISDTDLGNDTLMIKIVATDQLGRQHEVQEVCTIPTTPTTEMDQTITSSISTGDLTTMTVSPTASDANTAVILGVTLIAVGFIAVCILLLIFLYYMYQRQKKCGGGNLTESSSEANKPASVVMKEPDKTLIVEHLKQHYKLHEDPIIHCTISPDAEYLVTADAKMVVILHHIVNQNELVDHKPFNPKDSLEKKVSEHIKDSQLLLSLNWVNNDAEGMQLMLAYDNCVILWNILTNGVKIIFKPKSVPGQSKSSMPSMFCAACAPDGSAFAFSFTKAVENGTHHGDLLLRSTNGKEKLDEKTLFEQQQTVVSMSFSLTGKKLVTGSVDGIIRIYYDFNQLPVDPSCVESQTLSGSIWGVQFCSIDEQNVYALVDGKEFYQWNTRPTNFPSKKTDYEACERPSQLIIVAESDQAVGWKSFIPQPIWKPIWKLFKKNFSSEDEGYDHPVTWSNKLFASFFAYKYIIINSKGKKGLYEVDTQFNFIEVEGKLAEECFSCVDCVTCSDIATCAMVNVSGDDGNQFVKIFNLRYGSASEKTETTV